ncbi:MAG TPA: DNA recombination protein RmuC, partial [Acidimicrobiales bacterium]|nr:DNA recombination protein RmuC [Acidimicrobiales bacterium]
MISGLIIGLLVGAVAGVVVGLLVRSGHVARTRTAEARLADAVVANRRLTEEHAAQQQLRATAQAETARLSAQLEHERTINQERAAGFEETRQQLTGEFARLSGEALRRNNEQFLQLADSKLNETRQAAEGELGKRQEAIEQLLKPIGEQLGKYDDGMRRLEVERQRAYTTLTEQMQQLSTSHDHLQKETRSLVTALRAPQTRGRWGELQLRRVVEMAGMLERCDFDEQVTSSTDQGRLRPDMVVHLPGGKNVAVDAKVPMQAFLDANEAEDETTRRMHLANHGRQ